MLCREQSLIKYHATGFYAAPLCCRSWTCTYCRPERKARVTYQATLGRPDTFITLTTNPSRGTSPATRAAELVDAWRRFVRFAKKHYGYPKLPYFAVFEATRAGQPHLHILCRVKWIDQKLLSNFMREAVNAPIVDIRRCTSTRNAARYVSKYIGKEPGKFGTSKRYWQTRDYQQPSENPPPPPEYAGKGWHIIDRSIDQLIKSYGWMTGDVEKIGPVWKIKTKKPP